VAANGWSIIIELSGQWAGIGGTSASYCSKKEKKKKKKKKIHVLFCLFSSPIFAGMISLMNDARRKAGKPKLGFVNPVIYAMANTTGIFTRTGTSSNFCSLNCTLICLRILMCFLLLT
jgi:hypothetical protein